MLDWNDLRYLLAVAKTGSLNRAGRELGVHQTTVGRRLRALEEEVGTPLFLRSHRGLVPSSAARQLLAALEDVAATIESLERRKPFEPSDGEPAGLVRLAVTENAARLLIRFGLAEALRRHPRLSVDMIPANEAVDLGRDEAEVAVRVVPVDDPDLVRRRLGVVRYGLYAAPSYLASAEDPAVAELRGHALLMPSHVLSRGPEASWLAARSADARIALHASSLVTLAVAAEAGLGLVVLPTNLAMLHPGLSLVRALPEIPGRPVWLVLHRDLVNVPRIRVVADAVASIIATALRTSVAG